MTCEEALRALDDLIQQRSILQHPFYRAWQAGKLTRDQLATYARVYYQHVAAFPNYLKNAINCTRDSVTKVALEQNLDDELTNPAPHPELWLSFVTRCKTLRTSATLQFTRPLTSNIAQPSDPPSDVVWIPAPLPARL